MTDELNRQERVSWRQSVEDALAVVGVQRRWEVAILSALAQGQLRSSELLAEINSVEERYGRRGHRQPLSSRTFKDTLNRLERDGIVVSNSEATPQPTMRYRLTQQGEALLVALRPLDEWNRSRSRYRGRRSDD